MTSEAFDKECFNCMYSHEEETEMSNFLFKKHECDFKSLSRVFMILVMHFLY